MAAVLQRGFAMLAVTAMVAPLMSHAQKPPPEKFRIYVEQPAYTKLPVWLHADLKESFLYAHYPYREDPRDFGPNRIELKRNGSILNPQTTGHWYGSGDAGGILDGWIAPAGSPINRLPLHLEYSLDRPGLYAVRWTVVRHSFAGGRMTAVVVAQSDWLTFELKPSTTDQREAWLHRQLARPPHDAGPLVGDYLPTLLAAAPDPRALHRIAEQLYSPDPVVSNCALGGLGLFREDDVLGEALDLVRHRGASGSVATLLSTNAPWEQAWGWDVIGAIQPDLQSSDDKRVADTLTLLGYLAHPGNFSWPASSPVPGRADEAVLAAAPALASRGPEVMAPLAVYLGYVKTDAARALLWQLAERPEQEREQALTSLTWIGDRRDLPRLGEFLLKPGDPDPDGSDVAELPYALMHAYGDGAIPYLERGMSGSPYVFVRTNCAEELARKGRLEAFGFFLDAVENNRFYKQELVNWLEDNFPRGLPRNADDAAVVAFLKSRQKGSSATDP
ncbi:MAG TPA: hypothetical protein VL523_06660 [Terriglobia bacterium]|nr:hypothetical protein [Terriglobia bacterium]